MEEAQLVAQNMAIKIANMEIELAQLKVAYLKTKKEKEELEQSLEKNEVE